MSYLKALTLTVMVSQNDDLFLLSTVFQKHYDNHVLPTKYLFCPTNDIYLNDTNWLPFSP